MEIARSILGDSMPALQDGKLPIIAFCDNARKWQLVTSDEQGAIDYQEGLTLAYQLKLEAAAWKANLNYWPALKIAAAAAACITLVGYVGVRENAVYTQEEEFNGNNWYSPKGNTVSIIDQYKKRIEWGEARYPETKRDSHIYERFGNFYNALAGALAEAKRYDEAIASIAKSNVNARRSAEHSDDRSRSLIQLSDNAELQSKIMAAMGDSARAFALLDESITFSQDVAELRTTQRYYRRKLADRLCLRGKMQLDAGLFHEALRDYSADEVGQR
jgi:tetratricopeptide (TPR) repeat protein